jgi:glycosyltransferase involved in cell wall biosynthesis
MKIGIDISQTAYEGTGVANYVQRLVENLAMTDKKNEYVLFFSSLRKKVPAFAEEVVRKNKKFNLKIKKMPSTMLDVFWNKLHIMPVEDLVGDVDVFLSSDWTEPPSKRAKKVTILYDLVVYRYPEETHKRIVQTQRRRLGWVKKECDLILCISEQTKRDAMEILGIEEKRLRVVYPGI